MQALPPPDAPPPDAAEIPKLACDSGTTPTLAPAPEPTEFCARADGTRHGPFVSMFPDESVRIKGAYKDGKLDGAWERHYPGGALAEEGTFAAGQKDGSWRQLSPLGAVLGTYDMKAGTGLEKKWFDDGPLYLERVLKAGVQNGKYAMYDHDGNVVVTAKYIGGKYDGDHVVGYKANLRIEESFKLGVRRDARKIWQFWELVMEENYDPKGKLDGAFTIWRDAVKKIPRVSGTYDHGKRTGTWSWFDRLNNKEREGDYVDGKKTGAWFEWFENKLVFSSLYTDGKPDGDFVYYDKNSNELGRFDIKGGTGVMYTYYPNKKVATKTHVYQGAMDGSYQELSFRLPQKVTVDGRYANDRKHGAWKEFTELGIATLEQHWKRGKLDGPVKKFVDGKVSVESTYKDGKVDGPYIEYRGGKQSLVGQFASDLRTGTWTEYDDGGAVVLTATYKDGVLDGPWKQLESGAVVEGQMLAGRRTGTWTRTDRAGLVQKTTYKPPGA
jgi:antitoxin component YwqK of YwqJK toxin-antitoxin module